MMAGANPAAVQLQSGVAQVLRADAGNAYVDGHGLHVQTVFGHRRRPAAQEVVAPRRAVPADDIDLAVRVTHGGRKVAEQIEKVRINLMHVAGAMVA